MRTTLDIDGDVLLVAKEFARRDGKTAGKVVSELVRKALLHSTAAPHDAEGGEEFYGIRPLPPRGVVVTNELINQLREEDLD